MAYAAARCGERSNRPANWPWRLPRNAWPTPARSSKNWNCPNRSTVCTPRRTSIADSEGARLFLPEYINANALLAPDLRAKVESGITREELLEAYAVADPCRPVLDGMFGAALDVILTPSATGEAPEGLHTTGDAVFNRMWTLLHVPCVGIPVCRGPNNLPVGVTLAGPRLTDARLLAISKALAPIIDTDPKAGLRDLWG